MATVNLPDPTKLDSDTDSISEARPELKKIADAIVELGGQWNTNGGNFGGGGVEFPFTTNTFQITMGGSLTLPFEYATNFIEVGYDSDDSAGGGGEIEIKMDNWTGSGHCNVLFFGSDDDGSGSGFTGLDVNYTYGGSLIGQQGVNATGTILTRVSTVLWPAQGQYGSNYNFDIRLYTSTIGVSIGNYYIDSAGGR